MQKSGENASITFPLFNTKRAPRLRYNHDLPVVQTDLQSPVRNKNKVISWTELRRGSRRALIRYRKVSLPAFGIYQQSIGAEERDSLHNLPQLATVTTLQGRWNRILEMAFSS